jgi:nucleotide-binding universal stress UspA family protein
MFRNILVAIDGSGHAARAVSEAADLAKASNASLTLITSVPDASTWQVGVAYDAGAAYEALEDESEREYTKVLTDAAATLPGGLTATELLARGRPAAAILEQLHSGKYDLVVMGSRGRGGVKSLLLGSVSHEVLNGSPIAVLIVHEDEADKG